MLLALERRYRPEENVLHPMFLPLPPALRPSPSVPRPLPSTGTLRVLITGATGFLGSYVVRRLVQQGAAVTATGRDARRGAALGLRGASPLSPSTSAPATPPRSARCALASTP